MNEIELHSLTSSLSDWLSVDSVARSKLRLFLQLPGLSSKTESLPTLLTGRRNRSMKIGNQDCDYPNSVKMGDNREGRVGVNMKLIN